MYLSWLASGRTEPAKLVGHYWRLFLSGLEWRLFVEQQHDEELGVAVAELFLRYGPDPCGVPLAPWLHWWAHFNGPGAHRDLLDWMLQNGYRLFRPEEARLALADLTQAHLPLKVDLAYELIRLHPGRHPETRWHYEEPTFKRKFVTRFLERFPDGISLNRTAQTEEVFYRPECHNFRELARQAGYRPQLDCQIPDVWAANDDFKEVTSIWNRLVDEVLPPRLPRSHKPAPKPLCWDLNPEKVKALTEETRTIQGMLSQRSQGSHEPVPATTASRLKGLKTEAGKPVPIPSVLTSLDARYLGLLRDVVERSPWSRAEFGALAKRYNLMPDACHQEINLWALEALNDFLLDGQEVVHVNQQLLNQIPI